MNITVTSAPEAGGVRVAVGVAEGATGNGVAVGDVGAVGVRVGEGVEEGEKPGVRVGVGEGVGTTGNGVDVGAGGDVGAGRGVGVFVGIGGSGCASIPAVARKSPVAAATTHRTRPVYRPASRAA